jgi:hypothetical protein
LSDDLFGAQRFDLRSADAGPSAELFRIAHRTHPSDERSCGRHNTEPQIRRFDGLGRYATAIFGFTAELELIIFRWGLPVALQLTDAPAPRIQ